MSETSKKIIEEIHERNVKHRPKWYFLIKNISVWALLIAAIFLGALTMSIEESVLEKGIGVHGFFSSEFFLLLFRGISLLWLLCAVLFVVFAFLNLRLTKEGYRYRAWWIGLGILLLIVTLGLLLGHEGVGDRIESAAEHASWYHAYSDH
ncbi:MAG TPA: hypothetical protein VIJ29_00485 [Candidatus Paceibacterota bacterium]